MVLENINGKACLPPQEEIGACLVEMKAWEISRDEYKYGFALINDGQRIQGLDNHEHKEPHIHKEGREVPYDFVSLEKAIDDFRSMVKEVLKNERTNGQV